MPQIPTSRTVLTSLHEIVIIVSTSNEPVKLPTEDFSCLAEVRAKWPLREGRHVIVIGHMVTVFELNRRYCALQKNRKGHAPRKGGSREGGERRGVLSAELCINNGYVWRFSAQARKGDPY